MALVARHLHTPLPVVLDMYVEDFDHWFDVTMSVLKREAPKING